MTSWRSPATTRMLWADRSGTPGPASHGQPLRAMIPCRTSINPAVRPGRHEITVAPDWSTIVPHDLDSERVAVAFGGRCSCLALETVVIPALRGWVALNLRLAPVDVRPLPAGQGWRTGTVSTCCRGLTFTFAAQAATHARSHAHVARVQNVDGDVLAALASACKPELGSLRSSIHRPDAVARAASACRAGQRDVAYLWEAGVAPATIVRIQERVGTRRPLPRGFYLGVFAMRPDLRWLRECLAAATDRDDSVESWLPWTASSWDRDDRDARPRWLRLGVSSEAIACLGEAGIDPDDVAAYADRTGQTPDEVACSLAEPPTMPDPVPEADRPGRCAFRRRSRS